MIELSGILEETGAEQSAPDFPGSLLYFDIETTGLRAGSSSLYLIGLLYRTERGQKLVQYFAESMAEEEKLLRAFLSVLDSLEKPVYLVSYNGDMFDIPYIRRCAAQYGLSFGEDAFVSVDLYKALRPFGKLLGLPDLKLKTVEKWLGLAREDRYSGGELIYVYEEYVRLGRILKGGSEDTELNRKLRKKLLDTLLLHNAEDIRNLPPLLPLLGYGRLFSGSFEITGAKIAEFEGKRFLDLSIKAALPLPKDLALSDGPFSFGAQGTEAGLTAELYEGEAKYFFADVKNYYYLPLEDCAVHRSVGEFVDKKSRRKATAATCYQRRQGLFLPEPEPVFCPVFLKEYRGKMKYALFSEELLSDHGRLKEYVSAVLAGLLRTQAGRQGNGRTG